MRKAPFVASFAIATFFGASAWADSSRPFNYKPNAVKLSFGEFELDGGSQYWRTRREDFFGSEKNFTDDRWGLEYSRMVTERWGYLFNGHLWEGQQTTSFRDYVDNSGNDIFHETTLEIFEAGAGFVFYPFRRNTIVAPYIGGGLALVAYDLEERGDFVDFEDTALPIFSGTFRDSGSTLGWFWTAGVDIPIGSSIALFGQYTWTDASATLGSDFAGFGTIELGGEELGFGVSYRF